MPFNIQEFRANIGKRGLAKNNLFYAAITLPSTLTSLEQYITTKELTFLCKSANIPGQEVTVFGNKRSGFGKSINIPMEFESTQLSLIFMVDADFGVMKFFHKWFSSIFNLNHTYTVPDEFGKLPYELEYRDNYAATIVVYVYSYNNPSICYQYTFLNAFPSGIGSLDLSWENSAEIMTMQVQIDYEDVLTSVLTDADVNDEGIIRAYDMNGDMVEIMSTILPNQEQLKSPSE